MNPKLRAILLHLREPSTWAGVAGLAVALGAPVGTVSAAVQGIIGVASLAAIVLPERGDASGSSSSSGSGA
ncbi:MAG TPA: hypothetical protein P5024_12285 [Burkholderiaceae bacterium]|nr:hypothetical protein [Burkholderiaceae bacterium]